MYWILSDLNNGHVNIFSGNQFKWLHQLYYETFYSYKDPDKLELLTVLMDPKVLNRYKWDEYAEKDVDDIKTNEKSNLETKVIKENDLAYMEIKAMEDLSGLQQDYQEIRDFLKDIENYDKLIIDIRGNRGGLDKYWQYIVELLIDEPLTVKYYSFFKDGDREEDDLFRVPGASPIEDLDKKILESFPQEVKENFGFYNNYSVRVYPWNVSSDTSKQINFTGNIYLLIDENVFSSAEKFASFAKDTGFATLVGEPTGGDRVFEIIPIFHLPNTGFTIRYSRELSMNVDGTINMETKTTPHIQVNSTPHEDYSKDECIQAVLNDRE